MASWDHGDHAAGEKLFVDFDGDTHAGVPRDRR
jgi:hypothetical protein